VRIHITRLDSFGLGSFGKLTCLGSFGLDTHKIWFGFFWYSEKFDLGSFSSVVVMFYQNLNLLKWGLWAMYMDDDSDERSKVKWFYLLRRKKGQNTLSWAILDVFIWRNLCFWCKQRWINHFILLTSTSLK